MFPLHVPFTSYFTLKGVTTMHPRPRKAPTWRQYSIHAVAYSLSFISVGAEIFFRELGYDS